jgi:hypothetical protein
MAYAGMPLLEDILIKANVYGLIDCQTAFWAYSILRRLYLCAAIVEETLVGRPHATESSLSRHWH